MCTGWGPYRGVLHHLGSCPQEDPSQTWPLDSEPQNCELNKPLLFRNDPVYGILVLSNREQTKASPRFS